MKKTINGTFPASKWLSRGALLAGVILLPLTTPAVFADEVPVPAYRETQLGLYLSAVEAYDLLEDNPRAVLIDVRDPVEIKFTGFASPTDIHVPWVLADRDHFDAEARSWPMVKNADFEEEVAVALESLEVDEGDPVIVICRSGSTRSAPAADLIAAMGYTEVYSVTDGFEGGKLVEGDSMGVRAKSGWRNSGLPWSYQVDPEVAWTPGGDR